MKLFSDAFVHRLQSSAGTLIGLAMVSATLAGAVAPSLAFAATTETGFVSGSSITVGTPVTFTASSDDLVAPVTFSVADSAALSSTTVTSADIDAGSGVFTWTPTATDIGSHILTVTAVDSSAPPLSETATVSVTVTAAAVAPTIVPCSTGVGSNLLVNVTQQISNDPDSSNFDGSNWALDNFTRHIQIWQEGATYCGEADDTGTFTTFGGATGKSPQSGAALPEIVTGTMTGSTHGVLTGTFDGSSTWGNSGTAPAHDCNSTDCSMTEAWVSNYFPTGSYDYSDAPGAWGWTYNGGANGTWVNSSANGATGSGDIIHVPSSVVYVDGTTGNDSNDGSQAHPFLTIAAALAAVPAGGTVHIDAGTYAGGITVSKAVTIDGANAGISQNTATHTEGTVINSGTPGIEINTTDPVVINGLTFNGTGSPVGAGLDSNITIENSIIENTVGNATLYLANSAVFNYENNFTTNLSASSDEGIFLAGNWNGSTGTTVTMTGNLWKDTNMTGMNLSNVSGTISNNTFENVPYYGILVANNSPLTISGNTFDHITSPDLTVSTYGAGVRFYTPSLTGTVKITGNTFSNSYIGLGVRAPANLTGMDIEVRGNTFTGNTSDIKDDGTGTLNASLNYFGGSAPIVSGTGAAFVSYSPWYTDAGMTTLDTQTTTSGTTESTTLASAVDGSTTTSAGTVTVAIPTGTVVSGDSSWDGTINLPTVVSNPSVNFVGEAFGPTLSIQVGSPDVSLTLSNAARLLFPGQAGKQVGWSSDGGTFTPITATCSADTQAAADGLAAGADCTMTSGADLVVWTKHFTTFTTYTTTPVLSSNSGGGFSGGGGGGGSTVHTTGTVLASGPSVTTTTAQGQVLGASTFNFTRNLMVGLRGEDVTQLQTMLIADGYLNISAPTGYFGSLTHAAVIKYQTANSIPGTGFVGTLTLAKLNAGTTPTTVQESASMSSTAGLQDQLKVLQAELAQQLSASTTATATATSSSI